MTRRTGSGLTFSADMAGLTRAVRNQLGQFQSGNQAMKRVNEAALKYLKDASVDILDNKANRRERDLRTKVGLQVVEQDDAHIVNQDKFGFWVIDRIDGIDKRVRSYYRAIDKGSNYWVERTAGGNDWVSLVFLGNPSRPVPGGGRQAAYGDRRGARVIITNPVPRYAFLTQPVANFRRNKIYAGLVREEFKRLGLKAKITATP